MNGTVTYHDVLPEAGQRFLDEGKLVLPLGEKLLPFNTQFETHQQNWHLGSLPFAPPRCVVEDEPAVP